MFSTKNTNEQTLTILNPRTIDPLTQKEYNSTTELLINNFQNLDLEKLKNVAMCVDRFNVDLFLVKNIINGNIVFKGVADAFNLSYIDPAQLVSNK